LTISPFATRTFLLDWRRMGSPAFTLSLLLKYVPSAPESYVIWLRLDLY
jgi:hypothetical protein